MATVQRLQQGSSGCYEGVWCGRSRIVTLSGEKAHTSQRSSTASPSQSTSEGFLNLTSRSDDQEIPLPLMGTGSVSLQASLVHFFILIVSANCQTAKSVDRSGRRDPTLTGARHAEAKLRREWVRGPALVVHSHMQKARKWIALLTQSQIRTQIWATATATGNDQIR